MLAILLPLHRIRPVENAIAHRTQQLVEIRTAKVGAAAQLGEWIALRTDGVEHDVLRSIGVDALGEIGVDLEEVAPNPVYAWCAEGLRFEGREQRLEPFE